MFGRPHDAQVKIATYLLLAITLRSFVAAGWMLQIPVDGGLRAPLLSICPLQTPGLDGWLSNRGPDLAHHGVEQAEGGSEAALTISDPSCSVWANSVLATTAVFDPTMAPSPVALYIEQRQFFTLAPRFINSRQTRGPPKLS